MHAIIIVKAHPERVTVMRKRDTFHYPRVCIHKINANTIDVLFMHADFDLINLIL